MNNMAEKRDYYEVLGIDKNATLEEIKKAYKKLVIQYHPDKYSTKSIEEQKEAEEKFKEIAEAYDVLSNPEKKERYDTFGFNDATSQSFSDFDMDEFLEKQFGFFRNRKNAPQKGRSIRLKLSVSLKDLYYGVHKELKYKVLETCTHCNGNGHTETGHKDVCPVCKGLGKKQYAQNGWVTVETCGNCNGKGYIIHNPCPICHGEGLALTDKTIEFDIPKGAYGGLELGFNGFGHAPNGNIGEHGDLIILLLEKPDETFNREGNHLFIIKEVPIIDALLGNVVEVESIDNKTYRFPINVGTKEGEKFRIANKGMPIMGTNQYGDMYVVIKHKMPSQLNDKEKEMLENLSKMDNFI